MTACYVWFCATITIWQILLLCLTTVDSNRLLDFHSVEQYMNVCLNGTYHKPFPSPEKFLLNECSRYQDMSCCHGNTTIGLFLADRWHGLSYDHCPGHVISSQCRQYMMMELCFYECSPHVGPWLVEVGQVHRHERSYGVPLCRTQCDTWFDACKQEYTCITNWGRGFDWFNGSNACPKGSQCDTFERKFVSAENFCESIWDGGWSVVSDTQPCMRFDFNSSHHEPNPNRAVAFTRAFQILSSAVVLHAPVSVVILLPTYLAYWLSLQS